MASLESTGSPSSRFRPAHFTIYDEEEVQPSTAGATQPSAQPAAPCNKGSLGLEILSSSKLENSSAKTNDDNTGKAPAADKPLQQSCTINIDDQSQSSTNLQPKLSNLSIGSDEENVLPHEGSSSDTSLFTPTSGSRVHTDHSHEPIEAPSSNSRAEAVEVVRLQRELNKAQDQIARQAQQLGSNRLINQAGMQTIPIDSNPGQGPVVGQPTYAGFQRQAWINNEDAKPKLPEISGTSTDWPVNPRTGLAYGVQTDPWGFAGTRGYAHRDAGNLAPLMMPQEQHNRNYSVPLSPIGSGMQRGLQHSAGYNQSRGFGLSTYGTRGNGISMFNGPAAMNFNGMSAGSGMHGQGYQPQPIGTPLSPAANSFSPGQGPQQANPWNAGPTSSADHTYVPPMEPLNYRRLLDRSVSCNWKYIVDKIVCNHDQQASIFLQQKLKVGTVEQKFEIIEAIVAQAYPLMVNRFGNFLIQRCFEHGTPEQVVAIADAIRGNTLSLSMDPFGCHVVQKAFDSVPEDYKAIMVHELLRRIPETVIHRYACHVWQKLFELRWADSPPQIMKYVNEALRGMWHEVALGETGSLVVQNIFENCLEEDKRPCLSEVLHNIDIVAHGQFGNWCIQHICEHGAPADRSRAIEHILRYATEYSMDQFASKVVEKCLKIGGTEFLGRYLERVCEGRPDRPRMPLIDIASDQYGNYLIQWILMHHDGANREIVASQIRKHMVSLRGSKFGSRVAMLCSGPTPYIHATTAPPGNNRFSSAPTHMPRFAGAYR